jgi:hypothetical protein
MENERKKFIEEKIDDLKTSIEYFRKRLRDTKIELSLFEKELNDE